MSVADLSSIPEAAINDSGKDAVAADGSSEASTKDAASTTCSAQCHGSTTSTAPPLSVNGMSATTERAVGAHQTHLKSSAWHVQVQCADCHLVPQQITDTGHIDTALPAEVTFSAAAKADSASPAWGGTTCTGVYCHGATLNGGTATSPTWTQVDGSQAKCGACHGLPPGGGHTSSTSCSTCHGAVVDASMKIIAPNLHIDGKVSATGGGHPTGYASGLVHGADFNTKGPSACSSCHGAALTGGAGKSCETCHPGWKTKCTFCHGGTDNTTGAPPETVDGKTATTEPGVGRHTSHVTAGATHTAYGCALCHTVPQSALSSGHIDPSPAEVTFSGVASGASYNVSTYWCSNVYCHGSGKTGAKGSALWVGSLTGGCSACHDDDTDGSNMTLSGKHKKHVVDKNLGCSTCHSCVVNASKSITDSTKHVNNSHDVCGTNLGWDATAKSCDPSCHGKKTW